MVLYLRLWLFLFIIILGEMLLLKIKITIKTPQNTKRNMIIHMCFETKTVKQQNLKGPKREQFQGRFLSYFRPPFIKNHLVHFKCFKCFIGV